MFKIIVKGLVWQYISVILKGLIQVFVLAILSRLLTPSDFGLVGITSIFTNLAALISQLGVGPALIQRKAIVDHHIRVGFSLSIFFGLFMFLLLCVLSPRIAVFFDSEILKRLIPVVGLSFVITSFGTVSISLLQRKLMFKQLMIIELCSYLGGYGVVGILLAIMEYGVWSLIYAQITQSIISSLAAYLFIRHSLRPLISVEEMKDLIKFGFGFTLSRLLNYGANQGDYFVVGKLLGTTTLGLYTRAYHIMMLPAQYLGATLEKVMFPVISRFQTDVQKMRHYYLTGTFIISVICSPIAVFIVVNAAEIIEILLGPQWDETVVPLQILAIGIQFRTSYKLGDSLAKALGKVYQRSIREFIYLVLVLFGAVIGTYWGLTGVSLGVLIAILINFGMASSMSVKQLNISVVTYISTQVPGLLISFVLAFFLLPLHIILVDHGLNSVLILSTQLIVAILVFSSALLIQPRLMGKYRIQTVAMLKEILPIPYRNKGVFSLVLSRMGASYDR